MRAGVNHEELDQVQVATCSSRVLKTGNIRKKMKIMKKSRENDVHISMI